MSKFKHSVVVDGEVVWSKSFDDASSKNIPDEYRGRPADGDGSWSLFIDKECIGVQVSEAEEKQLSTQASIAPADDEVQS